MYKNYVHVRIVGIPYYGRFFVIHCMISMQDYLITVVFLDDIFRVIEQCNKMNLMNCILNGKFF